MVRSTGGHAVRPATRKAQGSKLSGSMANSLTVSYPYYPAPTAP
ncbi:MAG: hypothetical protein AAFP03_18580 [Cyanobacteria bacterium J06598_3]